MSTPVPLRRLRPQGGEERRSVNLAYKYFLGFAVDEQISDDTTTSCFQAAPHKRHNCVVMPRINIAGRNVLATKSYLIQSFNCTLQRNVKCSVFSTEACCHSSSSAKSGWLRPLLCLSLWGQLLCPYLILCSLSPCQPPGHTLAMRRTGFSLLCR